MSALRSLAVLVLLAAVPLALRALHAEYLLFAATRIAIYAIAAVALDFVLGFGGLVSFGHAAFVGIGGYTLAIAGVNGITEAALTLPLAGAASGLFALVTGAIGLRTSGVYFIMITLAFGQMAFFTAGSLAQYGGDDGMTLSGHSTLFGTALLEDRVAFYYVALAVWPPFCWGWAAWCGRASAGCCAAPGMRRSGCARWATARIRTACWPTPCPARWPGWRGRCWRN